MTTSSRIADADNLWEVAVLLPLTHTLTYRLPMVLEATARVGSAVRVPVGRRQLLGYLLSPALEAPPTAVRNVAAVLDPVPRFGPEMVPLFRWVSDYYQYPLGEVLGQIIPGGERASAPRLETWAALVAPLPPLPQRLGYKARALLAHLEQSGPSETRELERHFPGSRDTLRRLAARGLVLLTKCPAPLRNPLEGSPAGSDAGPLTLVPEQQEALDAIVAGLDTRTFAPFLLHGVTASGKTEVYLTAAAAALERDRQVLVLLPEIALAHPVAQAFQRRFGPRVTVLHSGLSAASRLDQWRRVVLGEVDIVVGARSAVFAPLPRLGLVVVDEEHDPSYKQEGGLLYQARDVALYRARMCGAAALLVSATPQISTYYLAQQGKYRYLNLSRRVTPQELPEIRLVNLREQRGERGLKIISRPLLQALEVVLARGEQAMLFLNRRGYARAMFCLVCGHIFQCRQCSVALTYHEASSQLVCHYCGYRAAVPEHCPLCQSTAIKRYGVGTEKVETEIRRLLPTARVARLDRDTAPHSGRALSVLEDFGAGHLDFLVGTQMIAKGHHFPRVTLVGVIAADLSLFFPEYHAGERTFQLLSQVSGRAGRGQEKGLVLIQTYHPEHYVFQAVQSQDYPGFFVRELESRRQSAYPPFVRLALIRLSGVAEEQVAREARRLARNLQALIEQERDLRSQLRLLGPAPAALTRLQGRYRWQILLKSHGRGPLLKSLEHLRRLWRVSPKSRLTLTLDIDPVNLL